LKKIQFILNKPQLTANIGMSVRSIGCFGFKNISLINPRHPWPNKDGINASKHFSSIAKKIKVFDNIEKSIKDSDLVIATSVRKRDFHIPFINLEDIKKKKFQKLSILFGQENNGLNNEEISHANFITTIPTLGSKSLNLSHSVSIIAYALTELTLKKEKILKQTQSLKSLEIEAFIGFLFNELDKKNFTSVKSKRDKLQISIRNYLKTSNLSQNDLKSVYGITKFLAN